MRRNKGFTLIELMIVIAIIAVIAAIAIPGLLQAQRASNERNASTSLKTVSSAQADFRANDRDGNKTNDFWTADVAGLYSIYNWVDTANTAPEPIGLIELSVAAADAMPILATNNSRGADPGNYGDIRAFSNHSSKAGYWYIMLVSQVVAGVTVTYQQATSGVTLGGTTLSMSCWHTSKFATMAFPDSLSAGKSAFIVNESNTVYKQQLADECRSVAGLVPAGLPSQGGLLGTSAETQWPSSADLKSYWQKLD